MPAMLAVRQLHKGKNCRARRTSLNKMFNNFSLQRVAPGLLDLIHSQWRFAMSLPITANAQAITHASPNAAAQANSPAKAARELATGSDPSTESPFGKLV